MWGKGLNRISVQLGLAVGALLIVVLATVGAVLVRDQRRFVFDQMQSQSDLFVRTLSFSSREAYFPKPDMFFLSCLAEDALKEKWLHGITLRDRNGHVILSKRKGEALPAGQRMATEGPISIRNEKVGSVEMEFSTEIVGTVVRRIVLRIAAIAIGTVLLGLVIAAVVIPFMVRPLIDLVKVAHEVGKGNFNVEVTGNSRNEIGLLSQTFNHMVKGLKDREIMREMFGRYFSPQVAKEIMKGNISLGGERKYITVLMCDIRDFTQLSEKLPPEKVVHFLNDYLSRMVGIVHKHQGTVDKFIGDAILAVFGAPLFNPTHTQSAVRCALEMRRAMAEFNAERQKEGLSPIRIGVAMCAGVAVAGNIGTSERREYTVIGDTVNLVSRLEDLNKRFGTDILVNDALYAAVRSHYYFRPLGSQGVRGREAPVEVYELLEAKERTEPVKPVPIRIDDCSRAA